MLPDAAFLAMARDTGHPKPEVIQNLLAQQAAHFSRGAQVTLFALAKSTGALSEAEATWFEAFHARTAASAAASDASVSNPPPKPAGLALPSPPPAPAPTGLAPPVAAASDSGRARRTTGRHELQPPAEKPAAERPSGGARASGRFRAAGAASSGRHRTLSASGEQGPPRKAGLPVGLVAGGAAGALGLVVVAVVAATSNPRSAAPAVAASTEAVTERPRADPNAAALAQETRTVRQLVEAGRSEEALVRIDRLLERWRDDAAAKDVGEELARLRDWVRDSERFEASKAGPSRSPKPEPTTRTAPAPPAAPRPQPRSGRDVAPAPPTDEEDEGPPAPASEPPPRTLPGDGARRPVPPSGAPTTKGAAPAPVAAGAATPTAPAPTIVRASSLDPAYCAKRAGIGAGDADALQRLARWAEKEDLFEEEKDALLLALRADPEHKRSRTRLDEILTAERRHASYATPWRRDASILYVETNTSQAWLHHYCDSVAAFYNRFSKIFRVTQDPLKTWGRKIGVKIFASREDFDRYRRESARGLSESAVGFYSLGEKELVLYHDPSDVEETLNTLFHEGTHLFCHLALGDRFDSLPIWVSEGIAEYFGTARFDRARKEVEYGRPSYGRLADARECIDRQNVSLRADLLEHTDYGSFGATRYALAWTLVHMLIEKRRPGSDRPVYRDRFVSYFDAVAGGADSFTAFEAQFGPVRVIEEEWKTYIREMPLPAYEQGMVKYVQGDLPAAVRLLEEHRRREPKDAKGAYWLGAALASSGRLDDAVEAYRAAVAIDSQHADAWHSLGWALYALARPAEALDAAQQAVAIRPSGDNQALLATVAIYAGEKAIALAAVREAIALLGPLPALRELQVLANRL